MDKCLFLNKLCGFIVKTYHYNSVILAKSNSLIYRNDAKLGIIYDFIRHHSLYVAIVKQLTLYYGCMCPKVKNNET